MYSYTQHTRKDTIGFSRLRAAQRTHVHGHTADRCERVANFGEAVPEPLRHPLVGPLVVVGGLARDIVEEVVQSDLIRDEAFPLVEPFVADHVPNVALTLKCMTCLFGLDHEFAFEFPPILDCLDLSSSLLLALLGGRGQRRKVRHMAGIVAMDKFSCFQSEFCFFGWPLQFLH